MSPAKTSSKSKPRTPTASKGKKTTRSTAKPSQKQSAKKSTSASPAQKKKATSKSVTAGGVKGKPASTTKKTTRSAVSRSKTTQKPVEKKGIISSVFETVSAIFIPSKTDAVNLLEADHDRVEKLFEKVKENENGNNKATFKKIKDELDVHTHIEETIFYPHLLKNGDKELKNIVQEGIEEHRQAKMFLAELAALEGSTDKFKAKIKVLMEDIEHHVKEEEKEMFPMVRDQIDKEKLEELGEQMAAEKLAKNGAKSKAAAK